MLVVTNLERFPDTFEAPGYGKCRSVAVRTVSEFLQYTSQPGVVALVNCDPSLTWQLAARRLFQPSPKLVALDLTIRRPANLRARALHLIRRRLFRRVDLFLHYFRDVRGLDEVWGIGPDRSVFIPFKPNLAPQPDMTPCVEGEYILCFGRSLRDFDTFFDAVAQLPYPAAIPEPNMEHLRAHGARFTRRLDQLPRNVRILPDDKSEEGQIRLLRGARLVVLPILKSSIVASGISTCLNAMLMGRCVIGSEGPGMSDIYTTEALMCPPEDANALALVIQRAWEDDALRQRTAEAGYRYAQSLGGERELHQRVIDALARDALEREHRRGAALGGTRH